MSKVIGSVGYRERIMLRPDAVISIVLEDVARMDVKSVRIGATSFAAQGGPPWAFTLEYDPAKVHEKGQYVLRARIEANGRLLFTSTERIPAFDEDPSKPVEIMVYKVSGRSTGGVAPSQKPNASLTNTYWKLIELNGEPAALGAGENELHMVLITEGNRVRGFSGCNTFMGTHRVTEDHLQFSQMASTKMACMVGMEQEQLFLSALEGTTGFKINGDSLSLHSANGKLLLRFEAVYLK